MAEPIKKQPSNSGVRRNIIFDDAPLDQAVEGIINGIFFQPGTYLLPVHVICAGISVQNTLLRKLKDRWNH